MKFRPELQRKGSPWLFSQIKLQTGKKIASLVSNKLKSSAGRLHRKEFHNKHAKAVA